MSQKQDQSQGSWRLATDVSDPYGTVVHQTLKLVCGCNIRWIGPFLYVTFCYHWRMWCALIEQLLLWAEPQCQVPTW